MGAVVRRSLGVPTFGLKMKLNSRNYVHLFFNHSLGSVNQVCRKGENPN